MWPVTQHLFSTATHFPTKQFFLSYNKSTLFAQNKLPPFLLSSGHYFNASEFHFKSQIKSFLPLQFLSLYWLTPFSFLYTKVEGFVLLLFIDEVKIKGLWTDKTSYIREWGDVLKARTLAWLVMRSGLLPHTTPRIWHPDHTFHWKIPIWGPGPVQRFTIMDSDIKGFEQYSPARSP
jgi:hypothetical protein